MGVGGEGRQAAVREGGQMRRLPQVAMKVKVWGVSWAMMHLMPGMRHRVQWFVRCGCGCMGNSNNTARHARTGGAPLHQNGSVKPIR